MIRETIQRSLEIDPRPGNRRRHSVLQKRASLVSLMAFGIACFALGGVSIPNWPAPPTWTPARTSGVHTMTVTLPLPLVSITPCRVADTRGNGFTGPYGPPSLTAGTSRNFTIVGQCGIPSGATAVSFNFAVTSLVANGNLVAWPQNDSMPTASTLNWTPSEGAIANAAVVALGVGGGLSVFVNGPAQTTDLIIDVNGYYAQTLNDFAGFHLDGNTSFTGIITGVNVSTSSSSYGVGGVGFNGVKGSSSTTFDGSAGVRGISGSGQATGTASLVEAGVVGESVGGLGVAGASQNQAGNFSLFDSGGNFLAGAILGQHVNAAPPVGVRFLNGLAGNGTKSFLEPHPTDPTKMIRYVSLEGPEAGTYFRGTGYVVHGQAVIDVPEDFRIVTDEEGLTVQLTPVGASASMYIASEGLDQIVVRASRDVKFHYLVQGVRRAYKDIQVITENTHFAPQSPNSSVFWAVSPVEQQRLIDNGTYNADGTPNLATAERVGWAAAWRERAARAARLEAERAKQTDEPVPH
jgi:hypothetical protein